MDIEHGHVVPRADGLKARCGGPTVCRQCALELSKQAQRGRDADQFASTNGTTIESPNGSGGSMRYDGGGGDSGGGGSSGDW